MSAGGRLLVEQDRVVHPDAQELLVTRDETFWVTVYRSQQDLWIDEIHGILREFGVYHPR